jgi:hypothetical protein
MGKNSSGSKFLFLFSVFSLLIIIAHAAAGITSGIQQTDTSKALKKDQPRIEIRDTTQPQIEDSSKILVKDAGQLEIPDSGEFQGQDTSMIKGIDSTGAPVAQAEEQIPDSIIFKQTTFSHEEIVRGERLFEGLVYLGSASINCASCHNTHESDTLNWNPDALEISKKFLDKDAFELSRVLLKPVGAKMKLVHKDFLLTATDIVQLKGFMDDFAHTGIKKNKPVITNLLLLIIASILFLISFADLIIKRVYKNPKINFLILTVTGVFITWLLVDKAIEFGRFDGFAPDQPIKFSHAVHAGQNKTDCNYCHYTAKTSKTAGIPSGSVCWNCHFLVRNGTRSGASEIAKIIDHLDQKKSVEWIRIYKLPDFVFFSHQQHVTAGEIDCEACHGTVKEMDRLEQVPDLSMGWCIDCHETRKVNFSNQYYKTYYPEFSDSLKAGKIDSVMVAGIGGKDCGKCHY